MIETVAQKAMVLYCCKGLSAEAGSSNAIVVAQFLEDGLWSVPFISSQVHFHCGPDKAPRSVADELLILSMEVGLVIEAIKIVRDNMGDNYSPPILNNNIFQEDGDDQA